MYLPALKNAIQNLEEKRFYDVALMYLSVLGYLELSMVDGAGDGGRDVVCSRIDLRIQLSVRKDWQKKINEEVVNTKKAGGHHLIYVTNKIVSPDSEQDFLQTNYKGRGEVDVYIHDLRRIVTALARPGVIRRAYELLGMYVPPTLEASASEIALSTILLFSKEAAELREEVIDANARAFLLKNSRISEDALVQHVASNVKGLNIERLARAAISRLRASGRIVGGPASLMLSATEHENMKGAETEFLAAIQADVDELSKVCSLSGEDSRKLINLALDLLMRGKDLSGIGPAEESLRAFMASRNLTRRRDKIFEALSKTKSATFRSFGATIDRVFSTNTFDIYRALGRKTTILVLLDSSVAMPVIFGLEFGAAKSRYGIAALALREACKAHKIKMAVPRCYLNEMAAHGRKALEKIEIYRSLPEEARASLRASGNAYLSHYTHISETLQASGEDLKLEEFLSHFGIVDGRTLDRIENRISSILESHDIEIMPNERYDRDVFELISERKMHEDRILIEHDAVVCTKLKSDDGLGFIFATWDKILIEIVEDVARVFADNPAKVIDFLSMAQGQEIEVDQSYELLSSLIYTEERVAQRLAEKIDAINSVDKTYKLRVLIDEARQRGGGGWTLKPEDVAPLLDGPAEDSALLIT